ncbi:NACHT, LRR and PYD domains-containing protein 12 [Coemansia sp. Benny D115]|nr:NACHT, LRR and PYD domains-containing protein 12 [Coemansia sp. Benny D115]
MDALQIVDIFPRDTLLTHLPKSSSSLSLKSNNDASVSSTVCEPANDLASNSEYISKKAHSREICFVDLEPSELSITQALGSRASETIECLRINGCRMNSDIFLALVDELCQLSLPNMHTVDMSKNQLCGSLFGASLARLLKHAPAIRTLSLGWNHLALQDLKDIAQIDCCNITTIDLRSNPLGQPKSKPSSRRSASSKVRRNKSISNSSTSSSDSACADADGDDMEWIAALISNMPHLTHVQLAQSTIDDKMLVKLVCALTAPSTPIEYIGLEWLELGSRLATLNSMLRNLVPKEGVESCPQNSLHLNLAANNIGDAGVDTISATGIRLVSLTLACNFITERGAGVLAKWLPFSGLTALDLSDNYFGDQGVVALTTMHSIENAGELYCTQIKSLALNSCCLSDVSLRLLTDSLSSNWAPLKTLKILRNSRMSSSAKLAL